MIGDEWLASGKTFLRIDCPPIGSANAVNCGLSTAPSALRLFNASAYESYGPMQFRVEVDPPSSGTVTVDYATANRTSGTKRALAGQDYYATSGTLAFAPGETAKFVVVGIIDDAVRDGGETFYLNFSNATGATLSDGQATGTINNTEPLVNPPSDPPDPSDPLTASFSGVPDEHTGESFTFGLTFSENVAGLSYKTLRDSAFSVTNGQITRARRETEGQQPGLDDHGQAGLKRGGDDPAPGDDRLRGRRRHLHQRRPEAFQFAVGDDSGGGGSGLCAFRQGSDHHLRDGARERGPPSEPSRYLFLRHRGRSDPRRIGSGLDGRSGSYGGRCSDGPDGDGAAGRTHDFDPRAGGAGVGIGDGTL